MSKQTLVARRQRPSLFHLLPLLVLVVASGAAQQAQAQTPAPWTTTGNNISNTNTGNVGVGTTAPGAKLTVSGAGIWDGAVLGLNNTGVGGREWSIFSTNDSFSQGGGRLLFYRNWADGSSGAMTIDAAGNVGIGTTSPGSTLSVSPPTGAASFDVTSQAAGGSAYASIQAGSSGQEARLNFITPAASTNYRIWRLGANGTDFTNTFQIDRLNDSGSAIIDIPIKIGEAGVILQQNGGNVGIGTTSPGSLLQVGGSGATAMATPTAIQLDNSYRSAVGGNTSLKFYLYRNGGETYGFGLNNAAGIEYHVGAAGGGAAYHAFYTDTTEKLRISSNGNVGIGTTTPAYKLDVAGAIRSSSGGITFPDGTTQTTAATAGSGGVWGDANTRTEYRDDAGAAGVGIKSGFYQTAAPVAGSWPVGANSWWHLLDVRHTNTANNYAMQFAGSFFDQQLYFRKTNNSATTAWSKVVLQDSGGNVGIGSTDGHFLRFHSSAGAGAYNGLVQAGDTSIIYSNGTQGTGGFVIAPWANATSGLRMNAAGDITVSGNINAKYQDLAEWVASSQQLAAGTVVVLDPDRNNQVLAATRAYDTSVAGVISARPGIALGEAGESKVLVATTGRVKVKVDATRAPIHVGDLLVTSEVTGVAMKSVPVEFGGVQLHRPGTLIGKALEPLAGGVGEILVLLSLQ